MSKINILHITEYHMISELIVIKSLLYRIEPRRFRASPGAKDSKRKLFPYSLYGKKIPFPSG